MAVERDFELLDDYVANRLQGDEKTSFEKKMESDPELQREYSLQQSLVEGIKKARISELKAMLNNTPIPPVQPGQTLLLAKIAAGILITGAVVTGIYYFMNNEGTEPIAQQVTPVPAPVEDSAFADENTKEEAVESVVVPEDVSKQEAKKTTQKKQESISAKEKVTEGTKPVKPGADVYDPAKEEPEEAATPLAPVVSKSDNAVKRSPVEGNTISNIKKYQFHYQVKDGKVYLYGSFEKGLYTILEIFNEKPTRFLMFKDNYYLLSDADDRIKPLRPIEDVNLINKLKEYGKRADQQ